MSPTERVLLVDRVRALMEEVAQERDWVRMVLEYRALIGHAEGTLIAVCPGGEYELPLPSALRREMALLRSITRSPRRGAWFTTVLTVERGAGWHIVYDREGEPAFSVPPLAVSYALDVRYHPRDFERIPPWLVERLRAEGAP